MHLRGKAMTMEAILPTGQTVVLSHVAEFNFNWHNAYVYADNAAPLLPKGTIVKIRAWHDNTAAQQDRIPIPTSGSGTATAPSTRWRHAWVNVTYLSDEDFLAEVEARRTALSQGTQQQQ